MEKNAWLFRGTGRAEGRRRIVDQNNSGLELLRYGRITLKDGSLPVATGEEEVVLLCLNGEGQVRTGGASYALGKYDALYIPRDSECTVLATGFFDVAEISAPVSKQYPIQLVRFSDVVKDPALAKDAGFVPYARKLHTIIGENNTRAGRLLVGVTFSKDGNWTSWPPHDHWEVKEEIYLYVDMPEPNFGLHLNYTDFREMEMVVPVWEGDAVAIKRGYHYNVATPGTQVGFVWMMAAIREEEDRAFSTVTVQPEFAGDRFKLF